MSAENEPDKLKTQGAQAQGAFRGKKPPHSVCGGVRCKRVAKHDAEGAITGDWPVARHAQSGSFAAALNITVPGSGYIYLGKWWRGVVTYLAIVALLVAFDGFHVAGVLIKCVMAHCLCLADGFENRPLVSSDDIHESGDTGAQERYVMGSVFLVASILAIYNAIY